MSTHVTVRVPRHDPRQGCVSSAHLGSSQRKHSVRRAKLLAPHAGQGQSPAAPHTKFRSSPTNSSTAIREDTTKARNSHPSYNACQLVQG